MPDSAPPPRSDLTQVLAAVRAAGPGAAEALLALVYDELRRMAEHQLGKLAPGQTLQATALVHEAWLKLQGGAGPDFAGRAHFFGAAGRAMRNILVDQARRKAAQRHGGGQRRRDLDPDLVAAESSGDDALVVDEALRAMEAVHPRKVRLVELRVYAGLTMPEIAEALGISLATAEREWSFARAWLAKSIGGGERNDAR